MANNTNMVAIHSLFRLYKTTLSAIDSSVLINMVRLILVQIEGLHSRDIKEKKD